ncbi:MAG: pyridoxamine 5'-phosphate oxidase [Saprospiraceae bacterium]|nr:pyridoxamine 5'-phosphate oxidase [Saprospiraceae bacterium]
MMKIADLRQDYSLQSLDIVDVAHDPIVQFKKWFDEALKSEILEPNAMTLATATPDGKPAARVVLLKGIEHQGFVFFTNYSSNKGDEISTNPYVALCFCWLELQRQVRIEGRIEKISESESESYFKSRPIGSQIGAWSSPQSKVIENRDFLEQQENYYKSLFNTEGGDGMTIPRPPHWGGYVVKPTMIEFWQGRQSRLHDRIRYSLENKDWRIERLAP